MTVDTLPCDTCGRQTPADRLGRELVVSAIDQVVTYWGRHCPGCARQLARRRRFGSFDAHCLELTRDVLEHAWGAKLQIIPLQEDERRWLVLARPKAIRPTRTEERPCT